MTLEKIEFFTIFIHERVKETVAPDSMLMISRFILESHIQLDCEHKGSPLCCIELDEISPSVLCNSDEYAPFIVQSRLYSAYGLRTDSLSYTCPRVVVLHELSTLSLNPSSGCPS